MLSMLGIPEHYRSFYTTHPHTHTPTPPTPPTPPNHTTHTTQSHHTLGQGV